LLPIVINSPHLPQKTADLEFRGYFYPTNGLDHQCQSAFTSTTKTLLYIDPNLNEDVWYSTNGSFASTTTAIASPTYNVHGDGVPVWWQSSDLAAFAAATGKPTSTATTLPSSSPPYSTSTSTNSPIPTPGPNGLTTGAKIGIGIGIPLVVIAIGIVGFIIYIRSRRKTRVAHSELQGTVMEKRPQEEPVVGTPMQELYSDNEPYRYSHVAGHAELAGQG
jgi:hypothetical protein